MKTRNLRVMWVLGLLLVLVLFSGTGCKPAVCGQMMKCCEEVKEVEGVGAACGPMAKGLSHEGTCQSVLDTIGYMLEDKQQAVPEICR